jgi:hypothetical protein
MKSWYCTGSGEYENLNALFHVSFVKEVGTGKLFYTRNKNYFIVVLYTMKNTLSIIELLLNKQYSIAMATTIATGRCTVLQLGLKPQHPALHNKLLTMEPLMHFMSLFLFAFLEYI